MKRFQRMLAFLLAVTLMFGSVGTIPVTAASEITVSTAMTKEEYTDGDVTMPYRLYVPETYDSAKKYPVIVFLHGAGERGDDNESQLVNGIQTLFDTQEQMQEAIVIAPQCPSGKRWVETNWALGNYDSSTIKEEQLATVMNILEDIQTKYSTDADRIYTIGISMGGFGAWNLLMNHSDVFAAGIPMCAGADVSKADILKDIPVWTFHGTADATVPYSGTVGMYNAIIAAGGESLKLTTYVGSAHAIWENVSATEGLIDWLFSQKLSERGNAAANENANLFDKDSEDNWLQSLSYNGAQLANVTKYSNIFATHKIEVKFGDILYWGGFAQENYVAELYAEDGTFLQQILFEDTQHIATGSTVQGVGTSAPEINRYAYKVMNENAGYVRILGNVTTKDSFAVYKNVEEPMEGWPYYEPEVESVLNGKRILFTGDSITAAVKDDYNLSGWAGRIGTTYGMIYKNAGISGASLSTSRGSTKRILPQILDNVSGDYEYLILHGGVNDAMDSVDIGTISDSYDVADFDTSTYAGGLEELFYQAYLNYDGAKIGYILNYATPNSTWGGNTTDMSAYFEMGKKICEKWDIPYLDLYSGTVEVDGETLSYSYDILEVDTGTNMYDNDEGEVHIGGSGYDLISPYIGVWVETLEACEMPEGMKDMFVEEYASQLLGYYSEYQEKAATDIERILSEMEEIDADAAALWTDFMNVWMNVNTEGHVNVAARNEEGVITKAELPEIVLKDQSGIPTDASTAIVILGYALNSDGTMTDELVGRLQVGLALSEEYPEAYIVVTGGQEKNGVTEAAAMSEWLYEQGVSEERVILEDKATNTINNAKNTYDLLVEKQVDSVVMVTSDYHIQRGSMCFHAVFLNKALENGSQEVKIVNNCGFDTTKSYEAFSSQVSVIKSILGISAASVQEPAVLKSLTITQEQPYVQGEELKLKVAANYDNGYTKDVSDQVTITGFDSNADANQTITISYTENDISISGTFTLTETESQLKDEKCKIQNKLDEINQLDFVSYTAESVEVMKIAIAYAEEVLADENASEEQLQEAYELLEKAENVLVLRQNIALNKPVTVSHNADNGYKITDGSTGTYWESVEESANIPIEETSFIIDLEGIYEIEGITAIPYFKGNERYYHYDIFVSLDNEEWTKVAEQRSTEDTLEAGATFDLETALMARYVKVEGLDVSVAERDDINNFHMTEMKVYGELIEAVEEDEEEMSLENLALYGKVTVDSGSKNYVLTDGVIENSYWGSSNGIENAYCTVELPGPALVEEVKIVTYYNNTAKWYTYEVLVSNDNETWISIGAYEEEVNIGSGGYTITLEEPVSARYVKVKGLTTNNTNLHLVEIAVYGTMKNIALNKTVTTSHVRSSNVKYAASNITDGYLSNSAYWDTGNVTDSVETWAATAEEDLPYVVIDLEDTYELDTVNVMGYYKVDRYYQYKVYTSTDGEVYTFMDQKDDTALSYFSNNFVPETQTQARYLKIVGTYCSVNPGFHLLEVRATGTLIPEEDADYSAVDAALKGVPEDLSIYTNSSVVDLKIAIMNVKNGLKKSRQAEVDAMAAAIEEAIEALVLKESTESELAKLSFYSISLKGNIALNYYMSLDESILTDSDAYMQFTLADGTITKIQADQGKTAKVSGNTYYVFSCEVAAKEMTDAVKSQFFYTEGSSDEYSHTVKGYADYMIQNSTDEALKELVTNMLHYGAAAQLEFDYNTENPANAGLDTPDYTAVTLDAFKDCSTEQGTELAVFNSASMILESETTLRFFFQVDESVTAFTATNDGEALEVNTRDGLYYADVTGIAAKDLEENVTIQINDGTNSADVTFNPMAYGYLVLSNAETADTLKNVVCAMYQYNQAANTYLERTN